MANRPSPIVALGLCASVWLLVAAVHCCGLVSPDALRLASWMIGSAATLLASLRLVIDRVNRPRLEGTWWGELRSNYADPSGKPLGPIPVALVIRQSSTSLSVSLHSRESSSSTLVAELIVDDDGRTVLVGIYRNEPRLPRQDTSRMHHGSIKLLVVEGPESRLRGTYWTDRSTSGEMELRLVARRRVLDFVTALELAGPQGPIVGLASEVPELGPAVLSPLQIAADEPVAPASLNEALCELLESLLNEAELRRFVDAVASSKIAARLPGKGASHADLAHEAVALLSREGLLQQALDRLRRAHPNRRRDIENALSRFTAKPSEPVPNEDHTPERPSEAAP